MRSGNEYGRSLWPSHQLADYDLADGSTLHLQRFDEKGGTGGNPWAVSVIHVLRVTPHRLKADDHVASTGPGDSAAEPHHHDRLSDESGVRRHPLPTQQRADDATV